MAFTVVEIVAVMEWNMLLAKMEGQNEDQEMS